MRRTVGRCGRERQSAGSILIIAMMMMVMTVFFGLSYLSTIEFRLQQGQITVQRLQAEGIAEGAIDLAFWRVKNGDYSKATDVALGGGEYTYTVVPTGDGFDLKAVAHVDNVYMTCLSRIDGEGGGVGYEGPFYLGGDVSGNCVSLSWDDEMLYGTTSSLAPGGSMRLLDTHTPFSLDAVRYDEIVTQFLSDGAILSGSQSGEFSGAGNISVNGDAIINGSIFSRGSVTFSGAGRDVELHSVVDGGVLYVQGNLTMDDIGTLVIRGSVFVEGNFSMTNIGRIDAQGTLVVNGSTSLNIPATTGTWAYDPAILSSVPRVVTDTPSAPLSNLKETWRRFKSGK